MIANARALGDELIVHGYKLITNGTDNHLVRKRGHRKGRGV